MTEKQLPSESINLQRVRVRFYFNESDTDREIRLENSRYTVTTNRGTIDSETTQTLSDGTEMYTIIASMPADLNLLGRNFDQKLNKGYHPLHSPDCAGAGEVVSL